MAWLPFASVIVDPARAAIERCAAAGIILSSVVTRNQLGVDFHAGLVIAPPNASTPHGTCESAMNLARDGIHLFFGSARFTGRDTVDVDGVRLSFKKALIATGSSPVLPDIPGLAEAGFLTNKTVMQGVGKIVGIAAPVAGMGSGWIVECLSPMHLVRPMSHCDYPCHIFYACRLKPAQEEATK